MLVHRVLTPDSSLDSWTVLGDGGPVEPIERYLAYLTDIEQSPNTIKAYAHDLKDWFVFLAARGLEWREGVALAAERIWSLRPAANRWRRLVGAAGGVLRDEARFRRRTSWCRRN